MSEFVGAGAGVGVGVGVGKEENLSMKSGPTGGVGNENDDVPVVSVSDGHVDGESKSGGEEKEESGGVEEKGSRAACISEDIAYVKRSIANAAVLTATREYITVVIMRTQYSRLQLRVQFTESYPNEPAIVEITSASLPTPLLRNKAKECVELVKNSLEVKQVAALCEGHGQMGIKEKEGILQFRLKGVEGYFQNFNITVPYMYPEEPIEIDFLKSQFPDDMQRMFYAQAEAMVARCIAGIPPDYSYQAELSTAATTSAAALKGSTSSQQPKVRLTADSIKGLKHDINVMKQMSELRAVDKVKDKRNQFSAHSTQERRDARKGLRRLAKAEAESDKAEQEKLLELEQKEMVALMGLKISETAIPSLLPVCKYLVHDFVVSMSNVKCQACNKALLPSEEQRAVTAASNGKKKRGAKNMTHIRANCGHWLHYHCLDTMLTTPPFLHHCAICQRQVGHPDWSDDFKQLERAWLLEQAKKRELADVSDFLDVGSEFTA